MLKSCIKTVYNMSILSAFLNIKKYVEFTPMQNPTRFTRVISNFTSILNTVNLFVFTDMNSYFYTFSTIPIITTTNLNKLIIINNELERG